MIEPLALEEWRRFDAAHPAPTFFARPAWACALGASFSLWEPFPLRVRTSRGAFIVPFVRSVGGTLRWRQLIGFPYGGYTCALSEDGSPADASDMERVFEQIAGAYDAVRLYLWPAAAPPRMGNGWRSGIHEAAIIDLAQGADTALDGFDGVSRRMAAQALRRGVVCERCGDPRSIEAYYALLLEAAHHWGLAQPTVTKTLLEAVLRYGNGDAEVWFARYDGAPIAGGVVLYGSQEMFFWSAAMRRSHGWLRPSNALNVALIQAAARRGVRWYNLGSSEGLPGVERFKRGLGARSIPYPDLSHERSLYAFYLQIRASYGRAIGARQ